MKRALAILAAVALMVSIPTAAHAVPSVVSVNVTMADGGLVPYGLRMEVADPSWALATSAPITGGTTTATVSGADLVEFGSYSVWILGNGYSHGQAITINSLTTTVDITLTRITGTVAVTVDTSDSAELPAGTTWTLTDVEGGTEASGTLASGVADGGTLPLGTVQFGVYTLTFDAPGYTAPPTTVTLNNGWVPDVTVPVTFTVPSADFQVSVVMQDAGVLPYGLEWAIFPSGEWTALASGSIPGGTTSFTGPSTVLPYGNYQVWITGSGYSSGQAVVFDQPTESQAFSLTRLSGTVEATVSTSDGAAVPAGSSWRLLDAGGTEVQSGTSFPGGEVPITGSLEYGTYTLEITAPGYAPSSTSVALTDPWDSSLTVSVTLLALVTDATVEFSMTDSGPLPSGLTWSIFPNGSWDAVASGPVTSGATSFSATASALPYGTYGVWLTGSGYSSGWTVVADGPTATWSYQIARQLGSVTATIDTDDDTSLPAGSTWELTDSDGAVVQSGILTEGLPDGGTVPLTNPIQYGSYTLTLTAYGYTTAIVAVEVTDPWDSSIEVTVDIQRAYSNLEVGAHMADGGVLPPGLTWSLFPAGSWDAIASGAVTPGAATFSTTAGLPLTYGVYQVWVTGAGYSSGQVLVIDQPTSGWEFELARLFGTVTATVDTSDDKPIAAGATWSLTDALGDVVQSGTTSAPIADGGALPLENPLEFGVYTLFVGAAGYTPIDVAVELTDPWNPDLVVAARLTAIPPVIPNPPVIPVTPTVPVTPASPAAPSTIAATGTPIDSLLIFASLSLLLGGLIIAEARRRKV